MANHIIFLLKLNTSMSNVHMKLTYTADSVYKSVSLDHIFSRILNFFDLSITEEAWVVEMRIWCIKMYGNVLVIYFNPWVEASAGGLLVYSPVAKYFGTCFKIWI
jgi:hypothetical protein